MSADTASSPGLLPHCRPAAQARGQCRGSPPRAAFGASQGWWRVWAGRSCRQRAPSMGSPQGKVGTRRGYGGVLPGPQAPSCAIPKMVSRGPPAPHQHLCLLPGSQKPAACPSPCLGLCLLPAWFLLSSNTLPFSPLHLSPGEEAQPQSSLRPVQRARTSVSGQGHGVQVCTSHPTQILGPESLCQATIRVNGVARAACLALSTPAPCPEPVKKVGSRCRPSSWQMELLRLGPPAPGVPEGPQGG